MMANSGQGPSIGPLPNPFEESQRSMTQHSALRVSDNQPDPLSITVYEPGLMGEYPTKLGCVITCFSSKETGMTFGCHLGAGEKHCEPDVTHAIQISVESILREHREEFVKSCLLGHESFRNSIPHQKYSNDTVAACDVAGLLQYHFAKRHPDWKKMCKFRGVGGMLVPKIPSSTGSTGRAEGEDGELDGQPRSVSRPPKQRPTIEGYRRQLAAPNRLEGTIPCPINWRYGETSLDLIKAGEGYGAAIKKGFTEDDGIMTAESLNTAITKGSNLPRQRARRSDIAARKTPEYMNASLDNYSTVPEWRRRSYTRSQPDLGNFWGFPSETEFASPNTSPNFQPDSLDAVNPRSGRHSHPSSSLQPHGHGIQPPSCGTGSTVLGQLFPHLGSPQQNGSQWHGDVDHQINRPLHPSWAAESNNNVTQTSAFNTGSEVLDALFPELGIPPIGESQGPGDKVYQSLQPFSQVSPDVASQIIPSNRGPGGVLNDGFSNNSSSSYRTRHPQDGDFSADHYGRQPQM